MNGIGICDFGCGDDSIGAQVAIGTARTTYSNGLIG
jgi:hypothetical protein